MTDEPKFCKDCKHYLPIPPIGQWQMAQQQNALSNWNRTIIVEPTKPPDHYWRDFCTHPSRRSLVTGRANEDPKMMRAGSCGTDALLWEEKPPAPPKVPEPVRQFTQADADAENARMGRATYQHSWWEFWK